jgi:hypothetical protein
MGILPNLKKEIVEGLSSSGVDEDHDQSYTFSMTFFVDGKDYGVFDNLQHSKRFWFTIEGSTHFDYPLGPFPPETANLYVSDDWTVKVKGSAQPAFTTPEIPTYVLIILSVIIASVVIGVLLILFKRKR